ncbi:hypothetical protein Q5752_003497 [Cryptotrichosporon argae]
MSARAFMKRWIPTETIPIFVVVGGACGGAAWYLWRLANGSEVVWDRHGDWKPWDKIHQHQNTKMLTVTPEFWAKRKEQYPDGKRVVDAI